MEILAKINQNSMKNKEETFTRLYRYLLRPDIYYTAYKNLYANNGAATKGINNDTADSFSETKITKIINMLKSETYKPKPVRRTYIEKTNGKKRPLGIPTFTDKLIQEALHMVLEAIYEPTFLEYSHGFRPYKSCHTALSTIQYGFNGTQWFIEGDIKACFERIDHTTLTEIIKKKIKDARIIKLIYKFLKAGYLENWQYHKTYSGTPQGGIISPLLANIYLTELDKFVMLTLKPEFDRPSEHRRNLQYKRLSSRLERKRCLIKKTSGIKRQQYIEEHKRDRALLLKIPSKSYTDKKLKYVRYCDDFLIGVCGSREDCLWIKSRLSEFIGLFLKMELSSEKTLITHSSQYARFLGYNIRVRRNSIMRPYRKYHCTKRTLLNIVELCVPLDDKIRKFILSRKVAKLRKGLFTPTHRSFLMGCTDLEILSIFNAELRGICNYYGMANNFYRLHNLGYLMEYSCLKTLAAKYKSKIGRIKRKFKDGRGGWCIAYETRAGVRHMYFAKYADCKKAKNASDVITNATMSYGAATTTFESRLKAKVCELCGTTKSGRFEIHHVNKVKNLKGKRFWERVMIAKRRKTMVVCKECHYKIHYT
ncbi:MAG: reverse transcriptase domain-containing protein [Candidatus Bathyarchaeota archaeon]|nr:reverse transcriptase domain-containing protein [Candidatus Termitimicrobium sp.]